MGAAVALTLGCSDRGPTSPSAVYQELWINCGIEPGGYQCESVVYSEAGAVRERKVTGLTTWSTSDPSIATVNGLGFVRVLQKGEVAIRAKYQGLEGYTSMGELKPGGMDYYYRTLSGIVRDNGTGAAIAGASIQVVTGANAGRTEQTGADGAYNMHELQPGTFSVRVTASGYATLEREVVLIGDRIFTGGNFTLLKR